MAKIFKKIPPQTPIPPISSGQLNSSDRLLINELFGKADSTHFQKHKELKLFKIPDKEQLWP